MSYLEDSQNVGEAPWPDQMWPNAGEYVEAVANGYTVRGVVVNRSISRGFWIELRTNTLDNGTEVIKRIYPSQFPTIRVIARG